MAKTYEEFLEAKQWMASDEMEDLMMGLFQELKELKEKNQELENASKADADYIEHLHRQRDGLFKKVNNPNEDELNRLKEELETKQDREDEIVRYLNSPKFSHDPYVERNDILLRLGRY